MSHYTALPVMQKTLVHWKFDTHFTYEIKKYTFHLEPGKPVDIIAFNKISVANDKGIYSTSVPARKFTTTYDAMISMDESDENNRLKKWLADFDEEVHVHAETMFNTK